MAKRFKILFFACLGGFVLGWLIFSGQRSEGLIDTAELVRRSSIMALIFMALPGTWYTLYFLAWLFFGPFDTHTGTGSVGTSSTDGGFTSGSSGGDCGGGGGGCD